MTKPDRLDQISRRGGNFRYDHDRRIADAKREFKQGTVTATPTNSGMVMVLVQGQEVPCVNNGGAVAAGQMVLVRQPVGAPAEIKGITGTVG
jgi:hypothetical protein